MEFFVFTYSIVLISIKSLHNTANFLNLDLETYLSTKVISNSRLGGNVRKLQLYLEVPPIELPPSLELEVTFVEKCVSKSKLRKCGSIVQTFN